MPTTFLTAPPGNDTLDGQGGNDILNGLTAAIIANLATPAINTGDARGNSYSYGGHNLSLIFSR